MRRLYEAPAYDTRVWPASHWRASSPGLAAFRPLGEDMRADTAIIGAGYAGLNAALELVERHGMQVVVLDAAQPGWGASGRNGGFACLGGTKLADGAIARRVGAEGLAAVRQFQHAAIERVDENLRHYGINAERGPDGEILLAHDARRAGRLAALAREEGTFIAKDDLREAGFNGAFHGAIVTPHGFPLHPMKYVLGLARAAQAAGVEIRGDSPVTSIDPVPEGWRLITPQGVVAARRVLVATNGYSSDDLPDWLAGRFLPVLSSILVTRPLSPAEKDAQGWTSQVMAYDSRHLLHYFRLLPCGRFMFGMRGGLSADPKALEGIQREARRHFEVLFPEWARVETETSWSGLACLTGSLAPFCAEVPGAPGLFAALGWHGNGVSAASHAGRLIAQAMSGAPSALPTLFRQPPRRLPLPRLRRLWLRLAYAAFAIADGPVRGPG